jgi:hypothetical protein
MRYFERLPIITPGTLVATSQGVASYLATGYLTDSIIFSSPLMQLSRNGQVFWELSDELIDICN